MNKWETDDTFLARWMAGELSDEELEEFRESDEFKQFKGIAESSSSFEVPEFDTEKSLEEWKAIRTEKQAKTKEETKIFSIGTAQKLAVAAILLVSLFLGYWFLFDLSPVVNVQTAYGEQAEVTLPDGSEIVLNATSSITYNTETWDDKRRVQLDGEAFFSVEDGESFTVSTSLGSVSVLGTEFNVKSRSSYFDAACYEGRINVEIENQSRELDAGQGVRYQSGEEIEQLNVKETTPSWRTGVITLNKVPLSVALAELESQFGIQIAQTDLPDTLTFTGSFPANSADAAVELVLDPFGFEYEYNSENQTLTITDQ